MSDLEKIEKYIGIHTNFPKKGVVFRDVLPIFEDDEIQKILIENCINIINHNYAEINTIAGIESRGFIFGAALAAKLEMKFIAIRKKGKLPGAVLTKTYKLEYGEDTLEIRKDSIKNTQKILLVDDLLATGGTAKAAIDLLNNFEIKVCGALFIIEILKLKGSAELNNSIPKYHSIFKY
jgi:adenine phosphoribosyltransferase